MTFLPSQSFILWHEEIDTIRLLSKEEQVMKKNICIILYCLIVSIQAFFCLCACETISSTGSKVTSASVNDKGELIIQLGNGQQINAGFIMGEDGLNGKDGADGVNGKSAYELYIDAFPDYKGTESEWIRDLTQGNLSDKSYTYGLSYSLLPDGTLSVEIGTAGNVEEIVIPAAHDGYVVTKIADEGFAGNITIRRVVLPETVTTIGENAFRCCVNLEFVNLPQSLTLIGAGAFDYCTNITFEDFRE